MAQPTDVFYGFCTFWTGDWEWLAEKNGMRPGRGPELPDVVAKALAEKGVTIQPRQRSSGTPAGFPHCPFCNSVGFEMDRESWLRKAREWEDGSSPKAGGVPHPGYVAMLMWGEKKCFPNYAALEAAWRAADSPTEQET